MTYEVIFNTKPF